MAQSTNRTALTDVRPNEIRVRGYRIEDLMGRLDFAGAVYLLLLGEIPSPPAQRLLDAMLVGVIDHGPSAHSVVATRHAVTTGATLTPAVASGLLCINRYHGGAVEDCAVILRGMVQMAHDEQRDLGDIARQWARDMKARKERAAGIGHLLHPSDPRTSRLFALARETGYHGQHVDACHALATAFSELLGRELPVNIDGAMAAVLCEMDVPTEAMNGLFMIARVPGLIAHALEERRREPPLRWIGGVAHTYDGPAPRGVEPIEE